MIQSISIASQKVAVILSPLTLENSLVYIGDWAAKLGNRGGTMGQT